MRLFIAVNLDPDISSSVEERLKPFRKNRPEIKWVKSSNLHFTLVFLGETQEMLVPFISQCVQQAVQGFPEFEISLSNVGFFPDQKHPKIIWLGVDKGNQLFSQLGQSVQVSLQQQKIPFDLKTFIPHLTIGRIKAKLSHQSLETITTSWEKVSGCQKINKLSLMQSRLQPQGAIYTVLETYFLKPKE